MYPSITWTFHFHFISVIFPSPDPLIEPLISRFSLTDHLRPINTKVTLARLSGGASHHRHFDCPLHTPPPHTPVTLISPALTVKGWRVFVCVFYARHLSTSSPYVKVSAPWIILNLFHRLPPHPVNTLFSHTLTPRGLSVYICPLLSSHLHVCVGNT